MKFSPAVCIFWASATWLGYVYIGYPALLWLLGFARRFEPALKEDFLPSVTVLISARNEAKDIGWKVRETLAWDYPGEKLKILVASDASDDGTDEILEAIRDPRFTSIRLEGRSGKNAALNRLASLATTDLLFFTDANTHIDAGCLRRMTRYFADPSVGCVTGVEVPEPAREQASIGAGSNTYLGYESFLNRLESRIGSVLVCDGSIFCLRRALYVPSVPELANDLELPIHVGAANAKVLFDPQARSSEHATSSAREEFDRRRRICGQGFLGMWKLRGSLRGLRLWQFVTRKALRWLTLIPLMAILFASGALIRQPFFAATFITELLFLGLGFLGWTLALAGRDGGRLFSLPFYFMLSYIGAITGLIETCMGRRFHVWESPALSRGHKVATT
ncbi:MAG TPA: glycosyltransferase family 2 protein [Candidatus Acidoferrales bacterium]|nr:glycosyltransferase family 2 protein [Candidatus Acidoferrales bacterium]